MARAREALRRGGEGDHRGLVQELPPRERRRSRLPLRSPRALAREQREGEEEVRRAHQRDRRRPPRRDGHRPQEPPRGGAARARLPRRGALGRAGQRHRALRHRSHAKEEKVAALMRLARLAKKRSPRPSARSRPTSACSISRRGTPRRRTLSSTTSRRARCGTTSSPSTRGSSQTGALRARRRARALQVAMVHWRMRGQPDAAEPWFERVRKLEPAHPGMLAFFREWCAGARGDRAACDHSHRRAAGHARRAGTRAIVAEIAKPRRGRGQRAEGDRAVAGGPPPGPGEQGARATR